jgi:hypothetical protein
MTTMTVMVSLLVNWICGPGDNKSRDNGMTMICCKRADQVKHGNREKNSNHDYIEEGSLVWQLMYG